MEGRLRRLSLAPPRDDAYEPGMTHTKRARTGSPVRPAAMCGPVEVLRAEQINEAYERERVLAGDVRYRFVTDTATS